MKIFKELAVLLLTIFVMVGCLASCDTSGKGQGAEENLNDYIINVKVSYATDDNKMQDALDALSGSNTTISVSGDNLAVESHTSTENTSVNEKYVLVGDLLYHEAEVAVGDKSASVKEKADFSGENRQALLSQIGVGADISIADFDYFEVASSGGVDYYSCSDILADSRDSLVKIFSSSFEGTGAIVSLSGAEYNVALRGEKILESTLSCHFEITMSGVVYEVTMHMEYTYEYSDSVEIAAPQNTEAYKEVSYEEILG